jgi:hypothetical protein
MKAANRCSIISIPTARRSLSAVIRAIRGRAESQIVESVTASATRDLPTHSRCPRRGRVASPQIQDPRPEIRDPRPQTSRLLTALLFRDRAEDIADFFVRSELIVKLV